MAAPVHRRGGAARAAKKLNFGVVLIPEGLVEFIPEVKALIAELKGKAWKFTRLPSGEPLAAPERFMERFSPDPYAARPQG